MMRLLPLVLALLVATPASAYCVSLPDSVDTGFSANSVDRAVCLQREAAEAARADAALSTLQIQLDALNRQLAFDRVHDTTILVRP